MRFKLNVIDSDKSWNKEIFESYFKAHCESLNSAQNYKNLKNQKKNYFKKFSLDLEKVFAMTINRFKIFKNCDIESSLLLTDAKELHKLNLEFRKIDKATDVLSFQSCDTIYKDIIEPLGKKQIFLGDMAFSYENMKKHCEENKKDFFEHTCFMLIHSALHLLGFEHDTDEQEEEMKKEEDAIMELVKLEVLKPYLIKKKI